MAGGSSKAIQVQYRITPPSGIDASSISLPVEQTLSAPVASSSKNYYRDLSLAVTQAQQSLNDSLTVWKDAVGEAERIKESAEKGRRQPIAGSEQASEVMDGSSEDEGGVEE